MSRTLLSRFAAAAIALLMGVGAMAGFDAGDDVSGDEEAGATWSFRVGDDDGDDDGKGWHRGTWGATWS